MYRWSLSQLYDALDVIALYERLELEQAERDRAAAQARRTR